MISQHQRNQTNHWFLVFYNHVEQALILKLFLTRVQSTIECAYSMDFLYSGWSVGACLDNPKTMISFVGSVWELVVYQPNDLQTQKLNEWKSWKDIKNSNWITTMNQSVSLNIFLRFFSLTQSKINSIPPVAAVFYQMSTYNNLHILSDLLAESIANNFRTASTWIAVLCISFSFGGWYPERRWAHERRRRRTDYEC